MPVKSGPTVTPIIVQARMSSARLPGKVLKPVAGRPLLSYLIESLGHCRNGGPIVVASSTEPSDDPIADFCANSEIQCVRGPLDDVMGRFLMAVDHIGAAQFVRVCGDSPLLDHRLIDRAIELFWKRRPDLVTNLFPRSFPAGQSVEVVDTACFRNAVNRASAPEHREHVTQFLYAEADRFEIINFEADEDWSAYKMAVDEPADLDLFADRLNSLPGPHWTIPLASQIDGLPATTAA